MYHWRLHTPPVGRADGLIRGARLAHHGGVQHVREQVRPPHLRLPVRELAQRLRRLAGDVEQAALGHVADLRLGGAQEVPERQRVPRRLARADQLLGQLEALRLWSVDLGVQHHRELLQQRARIGEERRERTPAGDRATLGAGRDEGLARALSERHLPLAHRQVGIAVGLHFECEVAADVDAVAGLRRDLEVAGSDLRQHVCDDAALRQPEARARVGELLERERRAGQEPYAADVLQLDRLRFDLRDDRPWLRAAVQRRGVATRVPPPHQRREHQRGRGEQDGPAWRRPDLLRQGRQWPARVGERRQQSLERHRVVVALAAAIPQVVVARAHDRPASVKSGRSFAMPRVRFTRTEPCVMPVSAAISGPLRPSTKRRTSVSR